MVYSTTALKELNMEYTVNTNPILPVAGVHRSLAEGISAGRALTGWRQDEDGSLNPPGRDLSEDSTRPKALLRCRRPFNIATFNVNTARTEPRALELAHCFEKSGYDIMGIQEHRRVHDDPVVFNQIEGQYLVTSSAWRNEAQASVGGVGLMLSPKARKALRKVTPITNRILVAEFDSNPVTTVIVIYAPTNVSPENVSEEFYEEFGGVIRDIPRHNFMFIVGDYNARLGPEDALFTFHNETNRNGKLLVDMMMEHDLIAVNTQFRKKEGKMWTQEDRYSGSKRQLDYILVRCKWRNSILNAEPYNSFCSVGSDHRVVGAKVRLSLRVPKRAQQVRYDWKKFSESPELQQQYTVEVQNRFQILDEDEDPTERYQRFVEANKEATEIVVPKKERTKKLSISKHPDVIQAREELEKACQNECGKNKEDHTEWVKSARDLLMATYDRLIEEDIRRKTDLINQTYGEGKTPMSWSIINETSGRKKAKEGQVEGASPQDRVTTWYNHFQKLLGAKPNEESEEEIPTVFSNLRINDGRFTMKEYLKVKSSLKLGKSSGPDNIPPEVFRKCEVDDIVLEICNLALTKNNKPDQWSLSNIIPVPKSGNLSKTDNYRGISLTCIIAKIFNRMILNRIRSAIDPKLRINQNGFRPGRTTVAQILALRRIIEGVKQKNLPAVLTFIDFKKAFDSIHRNKMMNILKAYGIPPNLLNAIGNMYTNTRAKVITPDGETEEFDISAGVLQGDTLAPFLFVIVLDYALRQATDGKEEELGFTIKRKLRSERYPGKTIIDLDFADDICLLCNEMDQAQELLHRVESECQKVGLGLNSKKTEVMTYNIPEHSPLKTISGDELKEVTDFKYLGSWVGSTEGDIKVRKALAWKALNGMTKIWKSNISRKAKIDFFIATVETVLLYGCEAWTLTESLKKSLNGTYTRMLRAALNISWMQKVPNSELYGNLPPLDRKIAGKRMGLAGHCFRHPELAASSLILWEPTHGKVSRGGRRTTFIDVLKSDACGGDKIKSTDRNDRMTTGDLANCMRNREDWRKRIKSRLRPP